MQRYIKPDYDFTYSGDMFDDYEQMLFVDFYCRISNLQGNYKDVLNTRDEYLNKPRDDYNKQMQKNGKKLCSPKQIEAFINRKKERIAKKQEIMMENHNEEYLQFLEERRKINE